MLSRFKITEGRIYPHVKILVSKIMYLTHLMLASGEGDIVLKAKTGRVKFIVFLASLLASKKLFIIKTHKELSNLIYKEKISMYITSKYDNRKDLIRNMNVVVIEIFDYDLINNTQTYDFIKFHWFTHEHLKSIYPIVKASFKKDRLSEFELRFMATMAINKKELLHMNGINYSTKNIVHMLQAVDSEFESEKSPIYFNSAVPFEKSFIYTLYFFLRGDLTNIGSETSIYNIISKSPWIKKMMVYDYESIIDKYHQEYKYKLLSKFNRFLNKWLLTQWITYFTYDHIFRESILSKKDEILVFNWDNHRHLGKAFSQARTKVSFIYGTPSDGYTLGINRYNDKETKILDNSYRIMDGSDSIRVEEDSFHRLSIGGSRIPKELKTVYVTNSKTKEDVFHPTGIYCRIEEEILTVLANKEDIYWDDNCQILTDIGTAKRALSELPYVLQVDVFEVNDKFIAAIDVDLKFIRLTWANPNYSEVNSHLRDSILKINKKYLMSGQQQIHNFIISKKFFEVTKGIEDIVNKESFYRLLSRQPLNHSDVYSKEDTKMKGDSLFAGE
jgi:hypothetical protein